MIEEPFEFDFDGEDEDEDDEDFEEEENFEADEEMISRNKKEMKKTVINNK